MIFLGITGWTLAYVVMQRPLEAVISAVIVLSGGVFYVAVRPKRTTP
jgi:APA family basic amino acid/polyamine antiporter